MRLSKQALSSLSIVITLGCLSAVPAQADTIWLTNGDQLTGKITLLDGGKLFIDTDYAGSVSVAWDKVKTFEAQNGLIIQGERYHDGVLYPSIKAGDNRHILVKQTGGDEQTLPLSNITTLVAPKPLVLDFAWKGNIDAGLSHKKSSTTTDNYDVTLSTSARHGTWRHNVDASYHKAEEDKVESTKKIGGEYALDKFVDEHFFLQGRYQYKRDWLENIKINRSLGFGPGYQFWDNDLGAFSLTALINSQTFVYQDDGRDDFYSGTLKWSWNRYLYSKTIEAFTSGEIGRSFDATTEMDLSADMGLRFKLTDWSSMSMKVTRTRTLSAQGNTNDTLYTMGVGVGW
ncbi:DUF481 domain-containing protein [Affinibrenneria salicis]|uniref:DUF481 domain-containing protein n=1 Tax=Affinibrenneria salicis TaxID=2590031 RepID=A0A5J5G506_9GAMM|nr:DUF481 domain-containing protein [Affinibrenneria salicis]KAA9001963.1 DUF481 domain-containing protein [Affinibrenneria salicis]